MPRPALALGAIVLVAALLWSVVVFQSGDEHEQGAEVAAPTHAPDPNAPGLAAPAAPTAPSDPAPAPSAAAAPTQPAEPQPAPSETPTPAPGEPEPPPSLGVPERSGPVDELKAEFEKSPRQSSAAADEAEIRQTFDSKEVPRELFKNAMCRGAVCKIEVVWTAERQYGYMHGLMQLNNKFAVEGTAIEPTGDANARGERPVTFYMKRKLE